VGVKKVKFGLERRFFIGEGGEKILGYLGKIFL
jgi:hypothetical protein